MTGGGASELDGGGGEGFCKARKGPQGWRLCPSRLAGAAALGLIWLLQCTSAGFLKRFCWHAPPRLSGRPLWVKDLPAVTNVVGFFLLRSLEAGGGLFLCQEHGWTVTGPSPLLPVWLAGRAGNPAGAGEGGVGRTVPILSPGWAALQNATLCQRAAGFGHGPGPPCWGPQGLDSCLREHSWGGRDGQSPWACGRVQRVWGAPACPGTGELEGWELAAIPGDGDGGHVFGGVFPRKATAGAQPWAPGPLRALLAILSAPQPVGREYPRGATAFGGGGVCRLRFRPPAACAPGEGARAALTLRRVVGPTESGRPVPRWERPVDPRAPPLSRLPREAPG